MLAAVVGLRVRGFVDHTDIHVWDELLYYFAGRDLVTDGVLPAVHLMPAYSVFYGALSLLPIPGHLPDFMGMLCMFGAPLAMWWALSPRLGRTWSLTAAICYAMGSAVDQGYCNGSTSSGHVYAFTAILTSLGIGMMARERWLWGWCLLLLVAQTRAETALWILAFATITALSPSLRRRVRWSPVACLLSLSLVVLVAAHPDIRARSWLAFCQHYGRAAYEADLRAQYPEAVDERDPQRLLQIVGGQQNLQRILDGFRLSMLRPETFVERDFPGATSVVGALRREPVRFVTHMANNATVAPKQLLLASLPARTGITLAWVIGATLTILASLGWIFGRRRLRQERADHRGSGPWILLLATSPLSLLATLPVETRTNLMFPLLPMLLAFWFGGLRAGCTTTAATRRWGGPVAVGLALLLAVLVPRPFSGPPPDLQHRDTLKVLGAALPPPNADRRIGILTSWGRVPMRLLQRGDLDLHGTAEGKGQLLADHLRQINPDYIVDTPELRAEMGHFADLQAVLASPSRRCVATRGRVRLLQREPIDGNVEHR